MLITTLIISYNGGYDWISTSRSVRVPVTLIGLFAAMTTCIFSGALNFGTGSMPAILRSVVSTSPVIIPLILIVANTVLLNRSLRLSVAENLYKWPLIGIALLGSLGVASFLYEYLSDLKREQSSRPASFVEDEQLNVQRKLADIDHCDVFTDMVAILVYTDSTQLHEIRSRAISKVKTNPKWQAELVRLLNTPYAAQAFNYIASNDFDKSVIGAGHIYNGILQETDVIKDEMNKATTSFDFYPGWHSWEVDRILIATDKFTPAQNQFLPAILKLRAALNESTPVKKPDFLALQSIDKWLKKHI